jgi:hypothetical protein
MDDAGEKWLNEQMPGIYAEVPEVIREVFARMPYDQGFTLSNGRVGRFKKFVEPRQKDGRWEFGFDIVFDEGSPDHLEFFVQHTGGGGLVAVPTTPIIEQVRSQ